MLDERAGERGAQTSSGAVADSTERQSQQRIADPEDAVQAELGVVGRTFVSLAAETIDDLLLRGVQRWHGDVLAAEVGR